MHVRVISAPQIDFWYEQDFRQTWGGTYQPALVQIEAKYSTWFGSNPSGLRTKLNAWVADCDVRCRYLTASLIADGNNKLDSCKVMVDNARPNWRDLNAFANAYLQMATKLMSFSSTSLIMFQSFSYCDAEKYGQDVVNKKCKWNAAIQNLMTKVFVSQSRSLFLSKVMETASTDCSSTAWGWPFSQSCSKSNCNYKWGLAISNSNWKKRLGSSDQEGKFVKLDESFSQKNSEATCQGFYDRWFQSRGFGYGGLYGYSDKVYDDPSYPFALRQGDCAAVTNWADSNIPFDYLTFGAIPNFCLNNDFPKCTALLHDDGLWGTNLEISDEPLVHYVANVRCKGLGEFRYTATGKDECWQKCGQRMQPIFFFTTSTGNQCDCYDTW